MARITPEALAAVVLLYRDAGGSMQLWGIPYDMRPGQSPRDLQRANNTAGWLWLCSPGWYGDVSPDEKALLLAYLDRQRAADRIPERPGEFDAAV